MSSNIINLYIPRILGNIKRNTIVNTFSNMNIGDIFYIDMYKKMNENNNPYYFAFISIKLYSNKNAEKLEKTLNEKGSTRLIYDYGKNHYWEVKKHIDRSLRNRVPSPTSVSAIGLIENEVEDGECKNTTLYTCWSMTDKDFNSTTHCLNTNFTNKDKNDLEKEYEELEKEIDVVVRFLYYTS